MVLSFARQARRCLKCPCQEVCQFAVALLRFSCPGSCPASLPRPCRFLRGFIHSCCNVSIFPIVETVSCGCPPRHSRAVHACCLSTLFNSAPLPQEPLQALLNSDIHQGKHATREQPHLHTRFVSPSTLATRPLATHRHVHKIRCSRWPCRHCCG